jgi:hypothetical protein
MENVYPDPERFGPMPAHGFFIRHAKGIEMRDVEIKSLKEDLRPALVLDDVEHVYLSHVRFPGENAGKLSLRNVRDFSLEQSRPVADTYLDSVTQQTI